MSQGKAKPQARLEELIAAANRKNIEVRSEKLLREVGYRVRSGRCRINGRELIFLDRDAPVAEQIEFLSTVIAEENAEPPETAPPRP